MIELEESIASITPGNKQASYEAKEIIDNLTKPIGSLGELENIAIKLSGIYNGLNYIDFRSNTIVMCADNGVVDEGVSRCPQEVTRTVTNNLTKDITGLSALSSYFGSSRTIIDIGVKGKLDNPLVYNCKLMEGTNNIIKGPAMTRETAIDAVKLGISIIDGLVEEGYNIFGTGEMGIGNTTTSAAVLSCLEGVSVDKVTGKGSGLTDEEYIHKKNIIKKAIDVNRPDPNDVIDVLAKVGGLDIAGLCGCFIGAAKNKVPIVIDGFISSVAALCAFRLSPDIKDYTFPSHLSSEPGAIYVMNALGLKPMLQLELRLGEGTGCPFAFSIIESALYTMLNMGTFEDANVNKETYIDIR